MARTVKTPQIQVIAIATSADIELFIYLDILERRNSPRD